MMKTLAAGIVLAMAGGAASAQLFGSDNNGNYFSIDEGSGAATIITGDDSTYNFLGGATEIEINPGTGMGYAQNPNGSLLGNTFDALTGASTSASVPTVGAFNGLEYVGNTLFGVYIISPQTPSVLATLDPTTGASVDVGLTGLNGAVNGLAYDGASGIMYGSTSANTLGPTSWLVAIDLGTGAATPIGDMGIVVGSIEFGSNGQLYGGGGQANSGQIFTIDTGTGVSTFLGDTGLGTTVTGLSLLPAPGTLALLGLGGLCVTRRRR